MPPRKQRGKCKETNPSRAVEKTGFEKVFLGQRDRYNGIALALNSTTLQDTDVPNNAFAAELGKRIAVWKKQGIKAIWINIAHSHTRFIEGTIACGFEPHHANSNGFMMNLWLGDGESKLPNFANHTVGAAGIVLVEKEGEMMVLAIQEKSGPTANLKNFWKLPGGTVDPGENISEAAVREVKEETGIDTTFVSLLAFRELHGSLYGTSDLYCICQLALADKNNNDNDDDDETNRNDNENLPKPVAQVEEIARAEWIPLNQFLSHRFYQPNVAHGRLMIEAANAATQNMHTHTQNMHTHTQNLGPNTQTGMNVVELPFGKSAAPTMTIYHTTTPHVSHKPPNLTSKL